MYQTQLVIKDMVNEMSLFPVYYLEEDKDKYPDLSYIALNINPDNEFESVFFLLNKLDALALADELIKLSHKL